MVPSGSAGRKLYRPPPCRQVRRRGGRRSATDRARGAIPPAFRSMSAHTAGVVKHPVGAQIAIAAKPQGAHLASVARARQVSQAPGPRSPSAHTPNPSDRAVHQKPCAGEAAGVARGGSSGVVRQLVMAVPKTIVIEHRVSPGSGSQPISVASTTAASTFIIHRDGTLAHVPVQRRRRPATLSPPPETARSTPGRAPRSRAGTDPRPARPRAAARLGGAGGRAVGGGDADLSAAVRRRSSNAVTRPVALQRFHRQCEAASAHAAQ